MPKHSLFTDLSVILDGPMTLPKAIAIAVLAHGHQEDKGQNSYIRHPLRIMEGLDTEDEMICGVLHDVVEDTDYTLEDLAALGCTSSQPMSLLYEHHRRCTLRGYITSQTSFTNTRFAS